jgi:hypothetical protein
LFIEKEFIRIIFSSTGDPFTKLSVRLSVERPLPVDSGDGSIREDPDPVFGFRRRTGEQLLFFVADGGVKQVTVCPFSGRSNHCALGRSFVQLGLNEADTFEFSSILIY